MKHTFQQIFRSPNFVIGFAIFMAVLLTVIVYPLFVTDHPLEIIGQGTFFEPGIYVNVYDSIGSPHYTLNLDDAAAKRIANKLGDEDRLAIKEWLMADGIPEDEIDIENTEKLLDQWVNNYDPAQKIAGMTNAKRNYFVRLNNSLKGLLSTEGVSIAVKNAETGDLEEAGIVVQSDYVNIRQVPNVRVLLLGTDNFGRDVLTELVAATGVSLRIGFVAGIIATSIGLILGLLSGYVGGLVDDILSRISDIILSFPVLVLYIIVIATIGASGFNIVIAITFASSPGIMRIVRGLVLDLRNRDYVAAAQTRGETDWRIMLVEILPNARGPLIVDACLRLGYVIITIGVLGFLGLGLPPPDPDWGGMVNETRQMAMVFPHMTLAPCIAISSLILGFNLLADGLREISLRD